jgi:hypothetical protein
MIHVALALLAVTTATPAGSETWAGDGSIEAPDGSNQGSFHMTLTNTVVDATTIETRGEIRLPDGTERSFWQRRTGSNTGYGLESDLGNGGGMCFDNGLCQSYVEGGPSGHAFATTIAPEGSHVLRVLVTELANGRAVRFFSEKLHRVR